MQALHIHTPMLESQALYMRFHKHVALKLELLQPPGSFKLRGIGRLCQFEKAHGSKSFVASSAGNAGTAVAYAGMKLDIPTTVFIPNNSHPIFIAAMQSYGAQVKFAGETWGDAHQAAGIFAKEHNASYIHPFDHPEIWAGHATIIDEIAQMRSTPPAAIIASVGGGGLACGLLLGMHKHGWHNVPLIAVETYGADAFAQSLQAGHSVILSTITSRATSLGTSYVTDRLLQWVQEHKIESLVVSDDEAEQGSREFARDKRMLVELSSGASLSIAYLNHPIMQNYDDVIVIVCGGLNTSHFSCIYT